MGEKVQHIETFFHAMEGKYKNLVCQSRNLSACVRKGQYYGFRAAHQLDRSPPSLDAVPHTQLYFNHADGDGGDNFRQDLIKTV